MRTTSPTLMVLGLLAVVGCADMPGSPARRTNIPLDPQASTEREPAPATPATVQGHLSSAGAGAVEQGLGGPRLLALASSVDVMALGANGELSLVEHTTVQPNGAFTTQLAPGGSPTGIFILKVKDLAGAIIGSGVVNGLPAFGKAFIIDAVVDTATSFKAEILTTLAKKGVPGVQNYLNIVDAYVNAQFANSVALIGVLATDFNGIVGAVADAVIAAEDVIEDALQKAGLPVDLSALQKAQAAAVSGLSGFVTSSTGALVTNSKNFLTALQAATSKNAAAIDDVLFNAIVNGGVMFGSTFKKGTTTLQAGADKPDLGFVVSQAIFALETALTTASAESTFGEGGFADSITDAVIKASAAFAAAVENAKTAGDLEAAKLAFTNALLGKQGQSILELLATAFGDLTAFLNDIEAMIQPLAKNLATAYATCDSHQIHIALEGFDAGTQALPAKLQAKVGAEAAAALANTLRLVKKQVAL